MRGILSDKRSAEELVADEPIDGLSEEGEDMDKRRLMRYGRGGLMRYGRGALLRYGRGGIMR